MSHTLGQFCVLECRHFQLDWNEAKATINLRKHGVSFELASSVFTDPQILTVADIEHSEFDERWFSVGLASNGALLSVAYLWTEQEPGLIRIRLISAHRATSVEVHYYKERQ